MKNQKLSSFLVLFLLIAWQCATHKPVAKTVAPNVLFIAIDDLRPELNCYGKKYMHTPNLDQLAAEGRLFNNHFVQVPTCGASRYALLLGQYPQYRKHLSNNVFRDDLAEAEQAGFQPLPKVLKQKGYYTAALGKISHYVDGKIFTYTGAGDGRPEMPDSWDYEWGPIGKWGTAWNAFFAYADGSNRNAKKRKGSPTEFVAKEDEDLPDGLIAQAAIKQLHQLKNQAQPFFLAVGFLKPHLPFVAPKKYWDLYDDKDLPLSPTPNMPKDITPTAVPNSGEMFGNYQGQPEKGGRGIRISDKHAMHLRRSYYSAVSYADAQVGRVLAALKETGLDKNTIIVIWGDHGWHLGDHTAWGKHSLFERSLKSAFIVKTPNMKQAGKASNAIVETVDIYPTLLDLCQINPPNFLAGKSLVPILNNPTATSGKPALSFWQNGYSMRTPQYRFAKYKEGATTHSALYDHTNDPNEANNLANDATYSTVLKELEKQCTKLMPASYWGSLK